MPLRSRAAAGAGAGLPRSTRPVRAPRPGPTSRPRLQLVGVGAMSASTRFARCAGVEPIPAAGLAVRTEMELTASGVLRVGARSDATPARLAYQLTELAADPAGAGCRIRDPGFHRPVVRRARCLSAGIVLRMGAWVRENRRGRTASDASFVTTNLGTPGFTNRRGHAVECAPGAGAATRSAWAEAHPGRHPGARRGRTPGPGGGGAEPRAVDLSHPRRIRRLVRRRAGRSSPSPVPFQLDPVARRQHPGTAHGRSC